MFKGIITALITPFKNNEVDFISLEKLINFQLAQGVDGLLILGSTGEAVSLSFDEKTEIIKLCVRLVNGSVPVIVGTSHSSTSKTLRYTQHAKSLKADAALIVCPYYNKPTQDGIYLHYKYINDNIDFPFIVYNNPARSSLNITHETLSNIINLKHAVAIKDSTSDLNRPQLLQKMILNKEFIQLSGEDLTAVAFNLYGGKGCISVLSNVIPSRLKKIQQLTEQNNYTHAQNEHLKYYHIMQMCFYETNPIPIKYMAYKLKLISSYEMRLPLTSLNSSFYNKINSELISLGLI